MRAITTIFIVACAVALSAVIGWVFGKQLGNIATFLVSLVIGVLVWVYRYAINRFLWRVIGSMGVQSWR